MSHSVAGVAAIHENPLDMSSSNETSQSKQTACFGGGYHTALPAQEVRIPGASHDPVESQSDFGCDDDLGVQQSVLPASSISPQQATQVINILVCAIDDVFAFEAEQCFIGSICKAHSEYPYSKVSRRYGRTGWGARGFFG